ncbi:hypothetical protein Tco_0665859 [Tanacetum coccineum]
MSIPSLWMNGPSRLDIGIALEPVYPEYIPPEDDVFLAEEQPLLAATSPTAESPGYIPESDPDEDPEEDPADYPADRDDDDEEEEEEHLMRILLIVTELPSLGLRKKYRLSLGMIYQQ